MRTFTLKALAAATSLLAFSQGSQALTPWTNGAPPAATTFYISGGAAQDQAFARVVRDSLAQSGSLDVFGDATTASSSDFGARWQVFYFRGGSGLGSLAGQPIAIVKRSLGAAGYGVIPIISSLAIEELDISTLTNPVSAEPASSSGAVPGVNNWRVVVNSGNASTLLPLKQSTAGVLGVDAKLLLFPGSLNYPAAVNRVGTGSDVFPAGITSVPSRIKQLSTGGLAYGVGVTTDFYKVLQAAQKRSGTLPSDTVTGDYANEKNIPTLSRQFLGSLLAGKIASWDQVKILDKTDNSVKSLLDVADAEGLGRPTANSGGRYPVAVGTRNAGAAIGALAYAKLLNYPWTAGSFSPAAGTSTAGEAGATPIVKQPGGTSATGRLLDDWNQGTNTSGLNNVSGAKRWGLAINTGERNASGAVGANPEDVGRQRWRYIRIDGALPTLENIANGSYPLWAEGVVLYDSNVVGAGSDALTVITALANGLKDPTTAGLVNNDLITTWGRSGIFGLTVEGASLSTPFDYSKPVVGYTHKNGSYLNEVVPTFFGASGGVLLK